MFKVKKNKNYDRIYREYEKAYKIGGLSKDDAWEVAYAKDSSRRFTLAQKYYEKGMDIRQISKKTGFTEPYLTRRLVFKEE
jgi:hypothetical protein